MGWGWGWGGDIVIAGDGQTSYLGVLAGLTCGHDLDAHITSIVLDADGTTQRLMLQAQHAAAARQEVACIVEGVETCTNNKGEWQCQELSLKLCVTQVGWV